MLLESFCESLVWTRLDFSNNKGITPCLICNQSHRRMMHIWFISRKKFPNSLIYFVIKIVVRLISACKHILSVFGVTLVRISRIWTKYGEIHSISLYSVQMRKNTDQNNSEYGHFSCSAHFIVVVFWATEGYLHPLSKRDYNFSFEKTL